MRRRAPSTLAEAIRGAIVRAIIMTAALAVGYAGMSHLVTVTRPSHDALLEDLMTDRPTAEHSPEWAMAEAERRDLVCWSGEAPDRYADALPTHVIWHHADGRAVVSSRLVGPALDTLFADGDLSGSPIAFCHTTR